ncbi:hypothetical protein PPBDW_II0353 [Photobacterium kishitanii]|nr:hypothetical protein PPBDW_II0353 [Photobacterium kishitanii]
MPNPFPHTTKIFFILYTLFVGYLGMNYFIALLLCRNLKG